jgi:hypothetical protein
MFAMVAVMMVAILAWLAFGAWVQIVPPTLELTPTHLVERVAWTRSRWTWNKVRNFRIVRWGKHKTLTFDREGWNWFGLADPDMPPTATLSFNFEVEPEALVELLNQAQEQWAGDVTPWHSGVQKPWPLRAGSAYIDRISAGGMTRARFWFATAVIAIVAAVMGLTFRELAFLAPIASAFCCFAVSRARLRDIGWPLAYSFALLAVAAYGLVISFMFSSSWASLIIAAVVIAVMVPLGFIKSGRGLKVYGS